MRASSAVKKRSGVRIVTLLSSGTACSTTSVGQCAACASWVTLIEADPLLRYP